MELHAAQTDSLPDLSLHAVHAELPGIPDGDDARIRVVVIPAPDEDGIVPTRDGRVHRVTDPRLLAASLNAQEVDARIDFDHQSEPTSPTFNGSTAAEGGWVRDYKATAAGAIEAELALSAEAATKLRARKYRYLSPGLRLEPGTGEVLAVSSVALVNNPNMPLEAPAVNSNAGTMKTTTTGTQTAEDLQAREDAVKAREEAVRKQELSAAEAAVDRAVEDKRLLPAQKDFALAAIKSHADGITAGVEAFEKAYSAEAADVDLDALERRTAPRGAPRKGAAAATAFEAPKGYAVTDDSVQLHGQVAEHARKRGISYRDAVLELGALQR